VLSDSALDDIEDGRVACELLIAVDGLVEDAITVVDWDDEEEIAEGLKDVELDSIESDDETAGCNCEDDTLDSKDDDMVTKADEYILEEAATLRKLEEINVVEWNSGVPSTQYLLIH
jgi:hypothetical protein